MYLPTKSSNSRDWFIVEKRLRKVLVGDGSRSPRVSQRSRRRRRGLLNKGCGVWSGDDLIFETPVPVC